ncbi:PLAC8 family-domain-containing protein [Lophiotrema nucula]|uniref:PLAC8 family-domain-containing protein n=1 Tax=Lophiotrema nucula TaxID=690887 RepID=A0A6A5YHU7_9PLEO|nr:PLAC8 family-domain-containing protein [Lophiotrema nucula]
MAAIQNREWHHSGSSCCSPIGSCCLAWWCPCISYGRTHHRVKFDGNMSGYSCCNGSCCGFTALGCLGLSFILPMIQRGDIRAKYHLNGNGCKDCLCACCCQPCDLVQQEKESKFHEDEKTRLVSQQPPKNGAMQYQQQPQYPQQAHY